MFGSGDYVELQFTANGESTAGKHLTTYFSGGMQRTDVLIPLDPLNTGTQRTFLVGNGSTVGGVTPDYNAASDLNLVGQDGAVCLTGPAPALTNLDCVAYGNYNNATGLPVGTPAVPTQFGQTIRRTIARGCTTALDGADDTNNSAADFALTTTPPVANVTVPTEKPCAGGGTVPPPGSNFKCGGKKATLIGSSGKDNIKGTAKRDVIVAFGGNDKVNGGGGNDVLCGNGGKDKLAGGKGKDKLVGGPKADKLIGGPGKDTLSGQGGNDTCNGGPGSDAEKSCGGASVSAPTPGTAY